MSFARPVPSKKNDPTMGIPPLPTLPKLPSRPQSKRPSLLPTAVKKDAKAQDIKSDNQMFPVPHQNDLKEIVNDLSTIVQRSEERLTPVKPALITTTIRRTASLHLTKVGLDRRKFVHPVLQSSNSSCQHIDKKDDGRSKLHDSISDRSSECNISISSSIPRRTSIRSLYNAEKYSGIKCALPSFTATVPNAFKGLEKHYTPIKNKQLNSSNSALDNQMTPAYTGGRETSPWRLRFEKFLNHEEPTPISPAIDTSNSMKPKISSLNKENRTPSFRPPARRTSKYNLPSQ